MTTRPIHSIGAALLVLAPLFFSVPAAFGAHSSSTPSETNDPRTPLVLCTQPLKQCLFDDAAGCTKSCPADQGCSMVTGSCTFGFGTDACCSCSGDVDDCNNS